MAPLNDNFADATLLTGSLPITRTGDTNVDATTEVDEPLTVNYAEVNPADEGAWNSATVWYKWECLASGTYRVRVDTSFDAMLSVYTGSSLATLSRVAQEDRSFYEPYWEECFFDAVAGTTYHIQVGKYGAYGDPGSIDIELDAASRPANDLFANAVAITSGQTISASNRGATTEPGESLRVANYAGVNYYGVAKTVWYTFTATADEEADLTLVPSGRWVTEFGQPTISVFTGSSVNTLTPVVETYDLFTRFTVSDGTAYFVQVGGGAAYGPEEGDFELSLLTHPPFLPANPTEVVLSSGSATITLDSTGAGTGAGEQITFPPSNITVSDTVWLVWAAGAEGVARLSISAEYSVGIGLYVAAPDGSLTLLNFQPYYGSPFNWEYDDTDVFYIQVGSTNGQAGEITATLTVEEPYSVATAPRWNVQAVVPLASPENYFFGLAVPPIYADGKWTVVVEPFYVADKALVVLTAPEPSGPWTQVPNPVPSQPLPYWFDSVAHHGGYYAAVGANHVNSTDPEAPRGYIWYWSTDPASVSTVLVSATARKWFTSIATDGQRWAAVDVKGAIYANTSSDPSGPYSLAYNFDYDTLGSPAVGAISRVSGEWVFATIGSTPVLRIWTSQHPAGPWNEVSNIEVPYYGSWTLSEPVISFSDGLYHFYNSNIGSFVSESLSGPWKRAYLDEDTVYGSFGSWFRYVHRAEGLAVGVDPGFPVIGSSDAYDVPFVAERLDRPADDDPPYNDYYSIGVIGIGYGNDEWLAVAQSFRSDIPYVLIYARDSDEVGSWGVSLA